MKQQKTYICKRTIKTNKYTSKDEAVSSGGVPTVVENAFDGVSINNLKFVGG